MASIYECTKEELSTLLEGEPRYRVEQLWHGLWVEGLSVESISTIPASLRARLAEEFPPALEVANDVASDGITANAVLPGLIHTQATAPQSEEEKRATWEQQAIKRMGEPGDVTGAILFLTSDDAAFITGQAIVVDGGQYRIG